MAIYDCFCFFNELDLLKIRLQQYYNIVDHFVIVECNKTQQGLSKEFFFENNIDSFKPWMQKIIYIKVDDVPSPAPKNNQETNQLDWFIEHFQRNCILRGLTHCTMDDVILISDIDEFIKPSLLKNINKVPVKPINREGGIKQKLRQTFRLLGIHKKLLYGGNVEDFIKYTPVAVEQEPCPYFMNATEKFKWYGSIITTFEQMQTPQTLREQRNILPFIPNGGYHFSYLGGKEKIKQKLNAIIEGGLISANPIYQNMYNKLSDSSTQKPNDVLPYIEWCLNNGIDIWNPKRKFYIRNSLSDINLTDINAIAHEYPQFFR